ncbi:hypothetical protein KAX22_01995, partial [bacterium]|nr:hypothetical protein [bacterium]
MKGFFLYPNPSSLNPNPFVILTKTNYNSCPLNHWILETSNFLTAPAQQQNKSLSWFITDYQLLSHLP